MVAVGPWLSAGVGLLTLAWAIVAYIRDSSGKRQADQAERAARMITLLREIDLGGADVGLDSTAARTLHEEQISSLQRVIRLGAVDFSDRALRSGLSIFATTAIAGYSVFFGVLGINISANNGVTDPAEKVVNSVSGLTLIGLGVAGRVVVVVSWRRRRKSSRRQRAAGIFVPTVRQSIEREISEIQTAMRVRSVRRKERAALKAAGPSS